MIFKPGRHGNDRLVVVVSDTANSQKSSELIDYLNIATSNPLMSVEFDFDEEEFRPLPGDSTKLYSIISSNITLLDTYYREIIIVALGSCCSTAVVVGHDLNASAILLISPSSSANWKKQSEAEIESRIIPTVILNKIQSSTQIHAFVDSRNLITRELLDIEPLAQNFNLYSYSWPIDISTEELIEYFKPLVSASILNINYNNTAVRSRIIDERSISAASQTGLCRYRSEIFHVANSDERFIVQGNAQIIGSAAEKYGRQHVKVVLDDGKSNHIFSVGPIRKNDISFKKWEVFQTDYSVSGFSTFGGHGLDIENLPLGTFEIRVQIKNRDLTGECSPSNSTISNEINFIHRDILSIVGFNCNRMFLSREKIDSMNSFKFPKDEITFTCIKSDLVLRSELFALFKILGTDIENVDLLFIGDRSFRVEGTSDATGKQLTASLDGATPLGDYRLFGISRHVTESGLIDFNVKLSITGTPTKVTLIRSAMGEQLFDYFGNLNRSRKLVETSLLNLNNLPTQANIDDSGPLVIDLLDLALLQLIDDSANSNQQYNPLIPEIYSEEVLAIASEYSSDWGLLHRDLESLVQRWPGKVFFHEIVIPSECEDSNGARFFFDSEFVRDLNTRLRNLESDFIEKNEVVRLSPWAKGVRAHMFDHSSPSPLQMEEVYFRRFERSLLHELDCGAKGIIILDDVDESGIGK